MKYALHHDEDAQKKKKKNENLKKSMAENIENDEKIDNQRLQILCTEGGDF